MNAVGRAPRGEEGAGPARTTLEEFFAGHPLGIEIHRWIAGLLGESFETRITKSQVALRRRRGFAYLWLPGRWLSGAHAEVVLSIALGRQIESPRFKQIVRPAQATWMHHLEVRSVDDLDGEVADWLVEAAADAS